MLQTVVPGIAPAFNPAFAPDWAQLSAHRAFLVRFAERRLLDPALAEDLVHDVFEAVMTGRARFAGRSALRSWLAAVLKHKIVDLIRERSGHDSLDACDEAGEPKYEFESPEPQPDERAEQRQRLRQALERVAALPIGLRQAFERRVIEDETTEEVCRALSISEDNLFVRLHRARRHLAS